MLQYLIILLDDKSTSFCHYNTHGKESRLIELEYLKKGIRFAMTENLMVQYVYPDSPLPQSYLDVMDSIDSHRIMPVGIDAENADAIIINGWKIEKITMTDKPVVLRTSKNELFENYSLIPELFDKVPHLNLVITDIESFHNVDFDKYKQVLLTLRHIIESKYIEGKEPQLNILTDRIALNRMNNCGAGVTSITLAPNGQFYICPAFYYEDENDTIGNLNDGINICNAQLYQIEYAPICSHCDAYQCKRCVWLNQKLTMEVNTPSREQCISSHLERNAARELLNVLREKKLTQRKEIEKIDYLDPFDKRDEWQ